MKMTESRRVTMLKRKGSSTKTTQTKNLSSKFQNLVR